MHPHRFLSLFFAALLALTPSALAQNTSDPASFENPIPATPTTDTKRPATIEGFRFGFSTFVPADCWSPLRIYISGNPAINSGAFGGTLTVEFAQDASQSASINIPIATTPGRVTPYEVLVALPRALPSVRITLRDESGRLVHERFLERLGLAGEQIPATLLDGVPLILALADRTGAEPPIARVLDAPDLSPAPQKFATFSGIAVSDDKRPDPYGLIRRVIVREEDLPESWMGYEGVTALVASSNALAVLSPAKSGALSQWVQSGGRLVILAQPGQLNWLRLLDASSEFLEIEPRHDSPVCAELREFVASAAKQAKEKKPPLKSKALKPPLPPPPPSSSPSPTSSSPPAPSPDPRLADSIQGSPIRVSDAGHAGGWRARWAEDQAQRTDGIPDVGMLAEGPVGLGWAVVLGIDPALMGANKPAIALAWRSSLQGVMKEADSRPFYPPSEWWISRGSGPDASARVALRTLFNRLSDVPPIGDGAFVIIVLCMVVLALALGPLDGIVLSLRKMRQWSWATALGWISVAAVGAAAIPPLVRSGGSTTRVFRTVDVLQSPADSGDAWQTTLMTLFSNSRHSVVFTGEAAESPAPRLWYRGTSPVHLDERNPSNPLVFFPSVQSEARAINSAGDSGAGRTNHPDPSIPLNMGQWTFRTLILQGQAADAPSARLVRDGDDWKVRVRGIRAARMTGALRVGPEWLVLKDHSVSGDQSSFRATIPNVANTKAEWTSLRSRENTEQIEADFSNPAFTVGTPLELPGPRERTAAIDALVSTRRWACVYLFCEEESPSLLARTRSSRGQPFDAKQTAVYRLVVPLSETDASPAGKEPPR